MNSPSSTLGDNARALVDSAAQTADNAIRSTQRVADQAMDQLASRVDDARFQAGSTVSRLATGAEQLTRRSLDAVRETSHQFSDKTRRATDTTIDHVRNEPVKSVLIAAAVGAALMALVTLVRSPRSPRE